MKLLKLFFRDEQEASIEYAEAWEVRWESVFSFSSISVFKTDQIRVFVSEEDANRFADALRDAHKLLRNTGKATWVRVNKQEAYT